MKNACPFTLYFKFWRYFLLIENLMNGHFKSEWTKIVLHFLLTKVNIWKFRRIILMNFSPRFLITVIQVTKFICMILTIFMLSIVVYLISLTMYTKIFFPLYGSVVRYQVVQQIWYLHTTSVDPCYYFLEWKFV